MAQLIAGPGISLPPPQALYPVSPVNAAFTAPTNSISLPGGAVQIIPAGTWVVGVGTVSCIQFLNPVTQQWTNINPVGTAFVGTIRSDGVNFRVINLAGSAYAATFTAGSGYVQSSTTVTAGTGNSTWLPIVGGALGTFTTVTAGSGYSKPPIVYIPPPPAPGVAATATAAISAGAVTTVTIRTAGAGYTVAPPVLLITDPDDPNLLAGSAIVQAAATVALTGAGTITAVLLVNFGTALASAPTLTVNGAGSSATATTVPSSLVAIGTGDVITLQPASAN